MLVGRLEGFQIWQMDVKVYSLFHNL